MDAGLRVVERDADARVREVELDERTAFDVVPCLCGGGVEQSPCFPVILLADADLAERS